MSANAVRMTVLGLLARRLEAGDDVVGAVQVVERRAALRAVEDRALVVGERVVHGHDLPGRDGVRGMGGHGLLRDVREIGRGGYPRPAAGSPEKAREARQR